MSEKIISLYNKKQEQGGRIVITDELLDELAEQYLDDEVEVPHNMTFIQWVEYKTMNMM